jgi:hypothetical protein
MQRRLLNAIINPATIVTWLAGLYPAGFHFVHLGIGSATEIHLLGAKTERRKWCLGRCGRPAIKPIGAEVNRNAGAVVGAEIPGIGMSTDENNLIRTLSKRRMQRRGLSEPWTD